MPCPLIRERGTSYIELGLADLALTDKQLMDAVSGETTRDVLVIGGGQPNTPLPTVSPGVVCGP